MSQTNKIYEIITSFLETPVLQVLNNYHCAGARFNCISPSTAKRNFIQLLNNPNVKIRSYRQDPNTVTIGDLAVLISELNLNTNGAIATQAAEIYFTCFAACESTCKDGRFVFEFENLEYNDYLSFAEKCGLSSSVRATYKGFSAGKNFKSNISQGELYNQIQLINGASKLDILIELLILPAAIITVIPFI